jgi:RNA polymerase sigma-70 factor (ECF subfamily)
MDVSPSAALAMSRYADGDDTAFTEVYELLVPRLESFLRRLTPDHALVQDVVQQTMLQLHRQRHRFTRGSEVHPWAFTIARCQLIDCLRAEKRYKSAREKLTAQETPQPASLEDLLTSMETRRLVTAQIRRLPDNQRIAIELLKQEERSLRDAAVILGTTTNAMKLRVRRAFVALQRMALVAG